MHRVVAVVLVVAMSQLVAACSGSRPANAPAPTPASSQGSTPLPTHVSAAANAFLARYVTSDGRALRHDQGDDVVSEGQAYGMLIAELANRPDLVRTIWTWTQAHLQRPDSLLAFHANASGTILDDQSAADADVLTSYALLRYDGPDQGRLHDDGKRVATAVLDVETTDVAGAPVIVAGPWAKATDPPTVNPSYWMPSVFAALAHLGDDQRWQWAATTAVELVRDATGAGRSLPTNWAQLDGGRLVPITDPGGPAPALYGLDAARLPVWFGTACTADARQLAVSWWHNALSRDDHAADLALTVGGAPLDEQTNPLPLLAAAAAADAAGDTAATGTLLTRAAQQSRKNPTYYGDAWLALGSALIDRSLDPCQEATDG
jgi:endoglucanase